MTKEIYIFVVKYRYRLQVPYSGTVMPSICLVQVMATKYTNLTWPNLTFNVPLSLQAN